MKIFVVVVAIIYFAINLLTAKLMSAKDMKESFIHGQCFVGLICANIFYAPAWFLKGIRFAILSAVK